MPLGATALAVAAAVVLAGGTPVDAELDPELIAQIPRPSATAARR